jgi:hypothetical protein
VRRAAAALALLLVASLARADVDPAAVPPELKDAFDTFRVRCSKCHPLTKPYSVRQTPDGWRRYVNKMKRRPGSGINEENGARIVAFLTWLESYKAGEGTDGGVP